MVKSMFAAVAGLRAHQTKMDVIGNNIANVNTYGYKAARATFTDMFYATSSGSSGSGDVYGGTNPTQIGYGSTIGSIDSLMTSGGRATTDNPTDCMINGNGFFVVGKKLEKEIELNDSTATAASSGSAKGDADATLLSSLSYTRVGNFKFDDEGYLVDSQGMVVYGFLADNTTSPAKIDTTKLVPIKKPATSSTNSTPMEFSEMSFADDGTIAGKTDSGSVTIGKIAVANVPNPNALERSEGGYYTAKNNTGTITVNEAGKNSTGKIDAGCLEMSNVDLSKEFTEMITCQRGYQANTRIITVTDAMLEELVNMKR